MKTELQQLQVYLGVHPNSESRDNIENRIAELQAKLWWQTLNLNQMDDYSFRFYNREFETLTPDEIQYIYTQK